MLYGLLAVAVIGGLSLKIGLDHRYGTRAERQLSVDKNEWKAENYYADFEKTMDQVNVNGISAQEYMDGIGLEFDNTGPADLFTPKPQVWLDA